MKKIIAFLLIIAAMATGIMSPVFSIAQDDATSTVSLIEIPMDNNAATSSVPVAPDDLGISATSTIPIDSANPTGMTSSSTSTQEIDSAGGSAMGASDASATSTDSIVGAPADAVKPASVDDVDDAADNNNNNKAEMLAPRVSAKWEMTGDGLDDSKAAGSQIIPAGKYRQSKQIKICGIVEAPVLGDVSGVYGQMFYPALAGFGPSDGKGRQGCGQAVAPRCAMQKLSWETGYNLFCAAIQKDNASLPTFAKKSDGSAGDPAAGLYGYDGLCGSNGDLMKDSVGVYCCDQDLAYDDISGDYQVTVMAADSQGNVSNVLTNTVTYLPLAAYEIDFGHIDYGTVQLNVESAVLGDTTWDTATSSKATIRNVGNTRLNASIWQDDMGMGKTNDIYNIMYGTRLGASDWIHYQPYETASFPQTLDLSQSEPLDFAVTVLKFAPPAAGQDTGQMKIEATVATDYSCSNH